VQGVCSMVLTSRLKYGSLFSTVADRRRLHSFAVLLELAADRKMLRHYTRPEIHSIDHILLSHLLVARNLEVQIDDRNCHLPSLAGCYTRQVHRLLVENRLLGTVLPVVHNRSWRPVVHIHQTPVDRTHRVPVDRIHRLPVGHIHR